MFSLFKKLFAKPAGPPPAATPVIEKSSRAPAPVLAPAAPAPPPPAAGPKLMPRQNGGMIELPLDEVLSRLPNDLSLLILSRPGGMFSIPADVAMEQLRTGAVRIPFAQLRQGSPAGTLANNTAHDDSLIDLPLNLIVAAVGTAGLARRRDQRQTIVPDEVTGLFGAKFSQNNHVHIAEKPLAPAPAPAPAPVLKPVTPVVLPPPAPKPTTSIVPPAAPKPPAPAPATIPFPAPKTPSPLPFAAARPAPPPQPAVPASEGESVVVTVDAVSAAWPAAVRNEIQLFNLGNAAISIPLASLAPGLKAGRVTFKWGELCGWLSSSVSQTVNAEVQVELPLQPLIPLFLAKHRPAAPRKIVSVGDNVPDLFAGLMRPFAPAPTPVAAPKAAEPPPPPPAKAKADSTPQEIARRILSLPGVAGAVLASSDGLLVAGQMPAPLKAETMAAFLPRIFTHAGLCVGEVALGTLRALRLSAGPALCIVYKAGALYLAVLGQPGQALPEAALDEIAAPLAQQKH